jgi:hypothetical protein
MPEYKPSLDPGGIMRAFLSLLLLTACSAVAAAASIDVASESRLVKAYNGLPLCFEENRGQADSWVKFLSHGSGYSLFLTSDQAMLALPSAAGSSTVAPVTKRLWEVSCV